MSLQNDPRLDFESGPGVMYLDLTCEDKEWAVTQKLTVLIGNMVSSWHTGPEIVKPFLSCSTAEPEILSSHKY